MRRSAPVWWEKRHHPVSTMLMPAAYCWSAAAYVRQCVVPSEQVPVPVICVGNAVAGGAGKTPVVRALVKFLKDHNRRNIYVLSRGYSGHLEGPIKVEPKIHGVLEVGDEPLMMAHDLPVIVSKDRVKGAEFAVSQGAEVIIMDDGLQNPGLHKDVSFMVVDGKYRFGNGRVIPAGPLREPLHRSMERSDAMIVVEGPFGVRDEDVPELHASFVPRSNTLAGKKAVAFAGIGRPEKFSATLRENGVQVVDFIPFPDHYVFRESDLQALLEKAQEQEALLVCTEKDAARLSPEWKAKVQVFAVDLAFAQTEALRRILQEAGIIHAAG